MNTAFVLGNGISRSFITIPELQKHGKVYACNAVYRTDTPDYLIAVDSRMVIEINSTGYQFKHEVWTNRRKIAGKFEGFNFFEPSLGWSSGPSALWLAASHKYDEIFILGFDYAGIDDGTKVNNLFAGTRNYKQKNSKATYFGNWLKQTTTVIKDNPKTKFTRIIQPDNYCPAELNSFENFSTSTVSDFLESINSSLISK